MIANPGGKLEVSLSGSASAVDTQLFWGNASDSKVSMSRVLRRIRLRGTGGITAVDVKLVDRDYAIVDGMTYSSIPDEYVIAEWPALAVTASATVGFLDDELTNLPRAYKSFGIVANVTAGSAWTIVGYVDVGT